MLPAVALDEEGIFSTAGAAGKHCLYYDSAERAGRWVVAAQVPGAPPRFVSRHVDLDEGLVALVTASGSDATRFHVDLPCGMGFSRPGRVDAASVLAAMEYVVAKGIRTYVVVESRPDASAEDVVASLTGGLVGRSFWVGDADRMEGTVPEAGVWFCDLTMPFEGPLRRNKAGERVLRCLHGTGLHPSACTDVVPATPVVPNMASVLAFPQIRKAA